MLENSTKSDDDLCKIAVAPYAGAWIETQIRPQKALFLWSLPTRERGLKPMSKRSWPFAVKSLPTRERGLKLSNPKARLLMAWVAPYAGAWIETYCLVIAVYNGSSRSLRGSVD